MSARLLVFGNAGWDLPLRVPRLPRAGETLLGERGGDSPGGKGLNQAVIAARAGADVLFIAPLGDDREGEALRAALAAEPLAFAAIPSRHRTDLSLLCVAEDGSNLILSTNACADGVDVAEAEAAAAWLAPGCMLLMQCGFLAAPTLAAARAGAARGARVLLNAAPLRWDIAPLLPLLDTLILNEVEAEAASGCADPADAALQLHQRGARQVIVTLGGEGAVCVDANGVRRQEAPAALVRDTTGAGDVFCGAYAAASLAGHADPMAAAQRAAAWSVSREGCFAAFPPASVLRAMVGP
ncbi:PfkB family carbohydrate kinase [Elioraea sp.]|uniref:PfkB family carbohydrate kinase n=1 Tax=Elioraea sp. TaxID=2185103 RepID=UPI0025C6D1BE|nr:PfkB family carbohydrate kinase [Elioraea sp.]